MASSCASVSGPIRIGLEVLAKSRAVDGLLDIVPHLHGIALHDDVRILTCHARIDESEDDLRAKDETTRAPQVVQALVHVDVEAIEHPLHLREHVVECGKAVGKDDALGTGVRYIALVPKCHVVEGNLRVCLDHTGQAADALGRDGVAFVRHRT